MNEPTATSPWGEPPPAYVAPERPVTDSGPKEWSTLSGLEARQVVYYSPRREGALRRALRISRATVGLTIIALGLGLALAATLGALVWVIADAIHHAASS